MRLNLNYIPLLLGGLPPHVVYPIYRGVVLSSNCVVRFGTENAGVVHKQLKI